MTNEQLKDITADIVFDGDIKFAEPMGRHTSLRIGGPSDIFAVSKNVPSLGRLLDYLRRNDTGFFPLGAGTNVLVKDAGIAGAVICLSSFRTIEQIGEDEDFVRLSVGAGTPLQQLVLHAREKGYSGIEGLAGIPGTVGGAICGNAGSFGYEMSNVVASVEVMRADGEVENVEVKDISFGYRKSTILPDNLVLGTEIKLGRDTQDRVSARIEHFLQVKRQRQPIWEPSAGCVFKNPEGFSAGKLIDEAGCKGMRVGDVVVSTVHANFFVNAGNASAADFLRLMHEVRARVAAAFGVTLEPEIKIIGRGNAHA